MTYKLTINPITCELDMVTDPTTIKHNDLQSRDAVACHPAKSVGVLNAQAMYPQDLGKNWETITVSGAGSFQWIRYLGNGICAAHDGNQIFRSTDYGKTWTITAPWLFQGRFACALGSGIIVAFSSSNIYRSTDQGLKWTDLGIASPNCYTSCYFGNGIVIAPGTSGNIFRSTDFGLTWTDLGVISSYGGFYASAYLGNGIAIVLDEYDYLFRSTDYGATWTEIINFGGNSTACYLGNGIVIVGDWNYGNVFRSTDYGLTWTDLGVFDANGIAMASVYLGNGTVIICSYGKHLFRSTDYGLTWTDLGIFANYAETCDYLGNGMAAFGGSGAILRCDTAFTADDETLILPKSSFFRQFWQKQGIAVQGTWAWIANANQTNYTSVTGEAAGYWENTDYVNLDEYKWSDVFLAAGTYKITIVTMTTPFRGIIEVLHGTTSLGTFDAYSAGTVYNVAAAITFTLVYPAKADLRFRVNGKNASSGNYIVEFSRFELEKTD